MKRMINNREILNILVITIVFTSCKKFVDISEPSNRLVKSNVFKTDQSATSAVIGIYSSIVNNPNFSSQPTIAMALCSDELSNTLDLNYSEFLNNNIQPLNSYNQSIWSAAYQYIYYSNSVIEGLESSAEVSDTTKNRLLGEAKFLRAFCYYYLINLWGPVPLIKSTNYKVTSLSGRTDSLELIQQMITDLKDAQALLSEYYITSEKARPNKWTATALLSRLYLSIGDYAKAESEATSIINSNMYSLAQINSAFLLASKETIWQLQPKIFAYSFVPTAFIPSSINSIPPYPLSSNLINAFESGDQRKVNWTKSNVVSGVTYFYPYKYKVNSGTTATEHLIVFRLAEQLLIRAEARAQQNNLSGAQSDLNQVRSRASLPNSTSSDKAALLLFIEKERQVELFTEWGDRWINLKRTGRIDAVLAPIKSSNWQATDKRWPIPQRQIDVNPNLSQNEGY
jgi:starch-binding outer membrane protein, SusD/RagB family